MIRETFVARIHKRSVRDRAVAHVTFTPQPLVTDEVVAEIKALGFIAWVVVEQEVLQRIVMVPHAGSVMLEYNARKVITLVGERTGITYEVDLNPFSFYSPTYYDESVDYRPRHMLLGQGYHTVFVPVQLPEHALLTRAFWPRRALNACVGTMLVGCLHVTSWWARIWQNPWWRL